MYMVMLINRKAKHVWIMLINRKAKSNMVSIIIWIFSIIIFIFEKQNLIWSCIWNEFGSNVNCYYCYIRFHFFYWVSQPIDSSVPGCLLAHDGHSLTGDVPGQPRPAPLPPSGGGPAHGPPHDLAQLPASLRRWSRTRPSPSSLLPPAAVPRTALHATSPRSLPPSGGGPTRGPPRDLAQLPASL
jgi:hypothetical protein